MSPNWEVSNVASINVSFYTLLKVKLKGQKTHISSTEFMCFD